MFLGHHQRSIDNKGRIIIPDDFRKNLSDTIYLTRGLEGCIFVFIQEEWERLYRSIASLPLTREEGRSFSRIFLANAASVSPDPLGRIMIPRPLRERANLKRKAMVVGTGTRIEIWSEEGWNRYSTEMEGRYEEIGKGLMDTGI